WWLILSGFDQFLNLGVDNTVEVNGKEKIDIGMMVIRGNSIVTVKALELVIIGNSVVTIETLKLVSKTQWHGFMSVMNVKSHVILGRPEGGGEGEGAGRGGTMMRQDIGELDRGFPFDVAL
ncbi:LSM domain, eukaryotic/archaea-type, partial [Dillenia turbinata]